MACLPTYNGVRYESLEALNAVLNPKGNQPPIINVEPKIKEVPEGQNVAPTTEAKAVEPKKVPQTLKSKRASKKRVATSLSYVKANLEKEMEYIKARTPFSIVTLERLIEAGNGLFAFGQYERGIITLHKYMEEGTGYHEMFHGIFDAFTNNKEKTRLYREFASREGSFIDRETKQTIAYSEATPSQAEEQMAEEYRDYVLTKKAPPKAKKGNFIQELLRRIFEFFNAVFTGQTKGLYDLFQKMDGGRYKNVPFKSPFSSDRKSRLTTVGSLDIKDSQTLVKQIVGDIVRKLLDEDNLKAIIEGDFSKVSVSETFTDIRNELEEIYRDEVPALMQAEGKTPEEISNVVTPMQESLRTGWDNAVKLSLEMLKTFNISADTSVLIEEDEDLENAEIAGKESESAAFSKDTLGIKDAFAYDGKMSAPAAMKLLITTLQHSLYVDANGVPISNFDEYEGVKEFSSVLDQSTRLETMVEFGKVFNKVLESLHTYNTLEEKLQALKNIGETNADYMRLYNRLGGDNKTSSMDEWYLKIIAFNTFSKQRVPEKAMFISEDGKTSDFGDLNQYTSVKQKTDDWLGSLKNKAGSASSYKGHLIVQDKSGRYLLNHLELAPLDTIDDVFPFLDSLEIPFDLEQQLRVTPEQLQSLFNEAKEIRDTLLSKKSGSTVNVGAHDFKVATSISDKGLGIKSRLTKVFDIYIKTKNIEPESTHLGVEGKPKGEFIQLNGLSKINNDINNSSTLDEVIEKVPRFSMPLIDGVSQYLRRWFSQTNPSKSKIKLTAIGGQVDNGNRDRNTPTKALSKGQRLLTSIISNLNKEFYVLIPADSSTEWAVELDHLTAYGAPIEDTINQLYDYYLAEKTLFSQDGRGRVFSTIEGLEGYKTSKAKFATIMTKFIKDEVEAQRDLLSSEEIIEEDGWEEGLFKFNGLDRAFAKAHGLDPEKLSEEDIQNILTFRTSNFMLNNIEIQMLYFGDFADYGTQANALKRYKSFMSPTEASLYGDPEFNRTANSYHNTHAGIGIIFKEGDPAFSLYNDVLKTVTSSNVETYNPLPGYDKNDSTDAQARCTLASYKQMGIRSARWNDGGQETQFQFEMSRDRLLMEEDGYFDYTKMYGKTKGRELKLEDQERVAAGDPHTATFAIWKPIVTGMDENGEVILDKLSIAPMTYYMVRGSNLALQYVRHLQHGISYEIYKSGRKVMASTYETDSMYNEDGSPNGEIDPSTNLTRGYKPRAIVDINYRWFGIQVETQGDKASQTVGSQMSAMASMNLLDNGVPVEFIKSHPNMESAREAWALMSDNDKRKASKEYDIIRREQEFRELMIEEGYQTLLSKLGAVDTGDDLVIRDKGKVVSLLQNELARRQISQNLKEGLSLTEQGEFELALEALPNYEQLKAILFSNIEKHISKQKVGGAAHIQQSGTGFEVAGTREVVTKNGKTYYVCKGLRFYTDEDGKRNMEVMLPCWFAKKLRASGLNMTDEELITYLNNTPEGKKILKGIGFRIPTQDTNSMDSIVVKAFTPESMGQTVVVPEELTTKSGSDFDVDKLNMYLKNIFVDANKKIRLVEYKGSEEATKEFYGKEFDPILVNKKKDVAKRIFGTQKALEIAKEEEDEKAIESIQDHLDHLLRLQSDLLDKKKQEIKKEQFMAERYREAIENSYFEAVTELLELPQNFNRITKPNSKDELKNISEQLEAISPSEFGEGHRHSILSPSYMNTTRHNFIASKSGVGIAAVNQKNTAVMQKGQVVIDPPLNSWKEISLEDPIEVQYLGDGQVLLPSNKVGGKTTLSGVTDQDGRLITSKISQYLDGFVDSVKDTFLLKMGINLKNVSVALLLEKLGVPNSPNSPIVAFFINQPIIREYIKLMDAKGAGRPYYDNNINEILNKFPVEKGTEIPTNYPSFSRKVDKNKALADFLKANIKDYYGKIPKEIDNTFQHFILNEFLKYSVISDNLFRYTQATNHDTAFLANPNEIDRKEYLTDNLATNNIFKNQISNNTLEESEKTGTILDNNFVGRVKVRAKQLTDMMRRDIFTFIGPEVRQHYQSVLEDYLKKNLPAEKFFTVSRKIEQAFITFLAQNGGDVRLNSRLHELMVDSEKALAIRLRQLQDSLKNDGNSALANNLIIKELITNNHITDGLPTKIIKFISRARDPFSSDVYTQSLYEIRDQNRPLYNDIITVGFIQAGVEKNPISFMDIVPTEDYAALLEAAFQSLGNPELLSAFTEVDAFYRMQWKNPKVVQVLHRKGKKSIMSFNKYKGTAVERLLKESNPDADFTNWITYTTDTESRQGKDKILVFRRDIPGLSAGDIKTRKAQGLPYEERVLLRRVDESDGTPFVQLYNPKFPKTFVTYIPVNAWGDGFRGQEAYTYPRQSVYDNGTYKVPVEFSNTELIRAFRGLSSPRSESLPNQPALVTIESDRTVEIQMGPKNVEKVLAGTKTLTLRSPRQFTEIGLAVGESAIAIFGGQQFRVSNRGLLSVSEAGGLDVVLAADGVNSIEELMYDNYKNWARGKGRMYVYDIAPLSTPGTEGLASTPEEQEALDKLIDDGTLSTECPF